MDNPTLLCYQNLTILFDLTASESRSQYGSAFSLILKRCLWEGASPKSVSFVARTRPLLALWRLMKSVYASRVLMTVSILVLKYSVLQSPFSTSNVMHITYGGRKSMPRQPACFQDGKHGRVVVKSGPTDWASELSLDSCLRQGSPME
ncbi:hypothetical protein J7T55_005903 [Diaporthe amygdali]|uniref:uncharacterized protein n=1 Tax=Phomopsis amygdali TaxID=1214568 RepID=UPI0022FE88A4|nr:uncharacterized protein J7T55_005903 [Diaporthe amygdali]KAJ0124564.1 hypothetical protein J7T55_005903 [Diaporthe amygdali]